MIDTIRFKIDIDSGLYETIRNKSTELVRRDNNIGVINLHLLRSDVRLGSYDNHLNIIVPNNNEMYLEFSVPKVMYGHNVYLLYKNKLYITIRYIHKKLEEYFGVFPDIDRWKVQRLDLCYSWKFENQDKAYDVLMLLRSFKVPRKTMVKWDNSVMGKGSDYTMKFYLKYDEFFAHDFKVMRKNKKYRDKSFDVLHLSEGVLRFEVTIREKQLKRDFGKKYISIFDIIKCDVDILLKKYFDKFMCYENKNTMKSEEVMQQLKLVYRPVKALHLWQFYELYHNSDEEKQRIMEDSVDRVTLWRYKSDLVNAGIGLPRDTIKMDFDLDIPSKFCINLESDL